MASLSLPRVLQLKKNSLDAEREQFEKFQTLAIQKAINAIETPVKEKHVRSTIIGTFKEQSAITYWMVAVRLPIQDNRIVAWKFCHVTHKLLREGHPACLDDSQRHISMIENLGKLWVHLREGYGKLVHLYCNLLVCKLKFHSRNPRFPGNMQLTADELDAIAENDVNNYFQLCVELFDYMDEILNLQASVFDSLGNARANSMTASGQCRLAALIPCAQDASQIYDCNVRLLFRLHASLPADTLSGHRERFRQQFKKLSSFYKHASSLQYYRNLLTLPVLPSNPPNFLQQSDFGTYVTPVVSIPEPSPDELDAVASLIDTSDTISQAPSDMMDDFEAHSSPSPQPDPIVERDRLIDHLQNELKRMRSEVSQLVQERNTMIGSMREHCTKIESQLHTARVQLDEEKQKAQVLSVQTPQIQQKLTETEEKAKVQDEKFQKLKGAYTQLREEHIALIRQKAEVDKLSASLRAATAQHESAKLALQQQLNDKMKDVELLQQSASSSEEIEAYKNEISHLRADIEQARQKEVELETVRAAMEALEIEHKTASQEQEERIITVTNELKETSENLEKIKQEKEERDAELVKVKEELLGLREKSGDEYNKVVGEREAALSQVAELKQQHLQEKEELSRLHDTISELQSELDSLKQKITISETDHETERIKLNQELLNKSDEINQVVNEKELAIKETSEKIDSLEQELQNKVTELSNLQDNVNDLLEYKKSSTELKTELLAERKAVSDQLKIESEEKERAEMNLKEKLEYISDLENKLKYLELDKNFEIVELHEDSQKAIDDKNEEIDVLKKLITEKDEFIEKQKNEIESLSDNIIQLNSSIELKTTEIKELNGKLNEAFSDLKGQNLEYDNRLRESNVEVTILKDKLQNVIESKDEIVANLKSMITEKDEQVISLNVNLTKLSEENIRLKDELEEAQAELEISNNELFTLREEHDAIVTSNDENLTLKNQELRDLHDKINEITKQKEELRVENNDLNAKKEVLETKILELEQSHETLKTSQHEVKYEKELLAIELNNELEKLRMDYKHLKDDKENEAQTFIDKINDLESFHEKEISQRNEAITLTDTNLQKMKEELVKLQELVTTERANTEVILSEKDLEKQVLESAILDLKESCKILKASHNEVKNEKESLTLELKNEIDKLRLDYKHLKDDKANEVQSLNDKIKDLESFNENEVSQRNEAITLADMNLQKMKEELEKLQTLVRTERTDMEVILSEKDLEKQMLENKIELVENKRLTAECELQDLLQHNTVLEADLAALKKQLEDAKKALEKQLSLLVTCVGDAALNVTKEAITALEQANTHETIKTSAESAAKALEELAKHSNVSGNEESIAKSAIVAAHNTAQLSAYVIDVSNIFSNIELSDKLQNECRSMLTATKDCLESIKSGSVVSSSCTEAQSLVHSMMTSAAAADRQNSGARSVDDELADMDRAIEEAASQIESMLAATRAGDSGVKLEVNGKILDACTTLMGAVKILVQDARKLQNELGDPKTRQKMYRKNPQWSEGLISAAKAVVFAAKLLVTSADEAVGAAGQVEGVSAAAHEVAGSTAQLVAASRARAPPDSPALARLTLASRHVAAATGALVAAVKAGSSLVLEQEALDTSALSLTATRRLEMESKVRSLKLETALDAERARLAALRKRHYQLAQLEENGNVENGKE